MLDKDFWRGKKVFITGHTGFKGSWLCLWLHSLGADVAGLSLSPPTNSKACAELITSSYRRSFFNPESYDLHKVALASVRAGNVIGGGDWAADRLVPDCIRALRSGD